MSRVAWPSSRRGQLAVLVPSALVALVVASAFGVRAVESASKGPAFEVASRFVGDDALVRRQLGAVVGFGFTVGGSVVESSDQGRARIDFDVIGSWRTGHATVRAVKVGGRWRVVDGALSVDGLRFPLRRRQQVPSF